MINFNNMYFQFKIHYQLILIIELESFPSYNSSNSTIFDKIVSIYQE